MRKQSQDYLHKLARLTLERFFEANEVLRVNESELPNEELKEKRGTFVTLHTGGLLHGCIGHIEPVQEIYKDVIENALSAAFDDPRFTPLQKEDLGSVEIEISVLTEPKPLSYSSPEDLLDKLKPSRDGIIIRKGSQSATYLPQVWEDLPDKEKFLSSLCQKAGLLPDEWRRGQLEVLIYQAEVFGE